MPDLWLPDASGTSRSLSSLRGRRTGVVVATRSRAKQFVDALAASAADFQADDIAVTAIVPAPEDHAPDAGSIDVCSDPDGAAHARLAGEHAWAAYVTDQFGEIYALFRGGTGDPLPVKDLLEWARFVNIRCEECFPHEWPDPES